MRILLLRGELYSLIPSLHLYPLLFPWFISLVSSLSLPFLSPLSTFIPKPQWTLVIYEACCVSCGTHPSGLNQSLQSYFTVQSSK